MRYVRSSLLALIGAGALSVWGCAADQVDTPPPELEGNANDADGGLEEETEGVASATLLPPGCDFYVSLYNAFDGYVRGYGQVICSRARRIRPLQVWLTRNGDLMLPLGMVDCDSTYCSTGATHWDNRGVQHWCVHARAFVDLTVTTRRKCGDF